MKVVLLLAALCVVLLPIAKSYAGPSGANIQDGGCDRRYYSCK